jgi:hypothetical protein
MGKPLFENPQARGTTDPTAGVDQSRPALDQDLLEQLAPSLVDDAFYRRARVLLRTAPLQRLRDLASRQSRWPATRRYDPMIIALSAVDQVMSRTGLANEYDFEGLTAEVALIASAAEPEAPPAEWGAVADWIVRSLMGENSSTSEYVVEHGDYRGGYHLTALSWYLLREHQRSDGRVVFVASVEAINSLRTGLDLDVEDAQLAQESVLAAQIERGDLENAERTADVGLQLSMELAAKMRELLDMTRFNLDIVDWKEQFQSRVRRALDHIDARIKAENLMLEHLAPGSDMDDASIKRRSGNIRGKLEHCLTQHRTLHQLLIDAPKVFLDEQLRQTLSGRTKSSLRISVLDDLLLPALALTPDPATAVTAMFTEALTGPSTRKLLNLGDLLGRLLHVTTSEPEPVLTEDDQVTLTERPSDELDTALLDAAYCVLATCRVETRLLSDLLVEADYPAVAELVRLFAQLLFDPEDTEAESAGLDAYSTIPLEGLRSVLADRTFHAAGYRGDDLFIGLATSFTPVIHLSSELLEPLPQGAPT